MSRTIKWLAKEQYPLTHNDEVFQFNLSACLRRKAIAKEPRSSKHRHSLTSNKWEGKRIPATPFTGNVFRCSIRLYLLQD